MVDYPWLPPSKTVRIPNLRCISVQQLEALAFQLETSIRPKMTKFLAKATEPDEDKRLYSPAMVWLCLGSG